MYAKNLIALLITAVTLAACGVDEHACGDRTEIARSGIEGARQQNLTCTIDDDCTLVDVSTDCQGACSDVVNAAGVAAVEAAIADANVGVCAENQAAGCGYATPGCVQMIPVCDAGSCAMEMP